MAKSESLGGLYVSVGLDAKPAIQAAQALQTELLNISTAINRLSSKTDLKNLAKQFDLVAAAAQKANIEVSKLASGVTTIPPVKAPKIDPASSSAVVKQAQQQSDKLKQIDERYIQNKLAQEQRLQQQIAQLRNSQYVSIGQKDALAKQAQYAADLRAQLQAQQISDSVFSKKLASVQRETTVIQQAADAKIAAERRVTAVAEAEAAKRLKAAEREAAQQKTLFQAIAGNSQSLLIGAGAFRSGNFFYGAAAVGGYFRSLLDGLKNVKSGAGEASGALSELGGSAGTAAVAARGVMSAGVALKAGAVALAAAIPALGVALTAVGAKIAEYGLSAAKDLEMLRIQYEGLLGSASKAKQEVDFVLALGTQSIVPTEQLLDANRLLLAFGVENKNARNSLLEYISAFSSVTGASLTQVQNLSYALGQINAAGKANAIDLRQLANAGVSTASIYEEIAKQQGISVGEAKKLSDEGKLYANVILPAILASAEKLKAAEDKARNSAQGILVNLKDIAKINLGQAFEGLLQTLKPVLLWVQSFIKAFDFKGIANAWMNVVGYFKKGFKNIGADATSTAKGMSETIAKAVNIVGYAAVRVAQFVVAVFDTLMVAVNFVWAGVQDGVAKLLYAVSAVMEAAAQIPGPWQEASRQVADTTWTLAEEASKGAKIASDAWVNGAYAAGNAWSNFFTNIPEFKPVAFEPVKPIELPEIGIPQWNDPIPEIEKGSKKTSDAIQKYLDRMLELLTKARDASKKLAEELTLPFAEAIKLGGAQVKTAAEEAFSSMDINTIVGKFSELKDQIVNLYAPLTNVEAAGSKALANKAKKERDGIIADLRSQTFELVRLASENKRLAKELEDAQKAFDIAAEGFAKSRENLNKQYAGQQKAIAQQYDGYYKATSMTTGSFVKGSIQAAQEALDTATAAYEKAKDKLDELKAARDSFLESVASSLRSYVNNLSNITKEIQTYTRLDALGSFSLTTSNEADLDAFKKSLNDRLEALRTWRRQVQELLSRGLDSEFVKSLVAAGPDSTKDIVSALAGASNTELQDINRVQMELSSEITAMQQAASAQWYDAGIAAQEAFLAPLKSAYDTAKKNLDDLQAAKDMALGILEAWYADQNALIDTQEQAAKDAFDKTKKDLEDKMGANQKKAEEIAMTINGIWTELPGKAYIGGVNTMIALIEGLKSKEKVLKAEADRIAGILESTIRKALQTNSPSKVMQSIGEDVVDGLILGMQKDGILQNTTLDLSGFVNAASTLPDLQPAETTVQQEIRVFIGDKELTDIVNVQIDQSNNVNTDLVIAGRRY